MHNKTTIGEEETILDTIERLNKLKHRMEDNGLLNDVKVVDDTIDIIKHLVTTGPYGVTLQDIDK